MKNSVYIFLISLLLPFCGLTQVVENIDYVSPFHDGFAAVKKGGQWAFINEKGTFVMQYRDDLVPIKMEEGMYPVLKNGRALIQESNEGIVFYGYIDMNERIVIKPQFINALNFKFDKAIATTLTKNKLGYNAVMDKPVVSHEYQEILIDSNGNIIAYLTEPKPITLAKPFLNIPGIKSELISENLVITRLEDGNMVLTKIEGPELF